MGQSFKDLVVWQHAIQLTLVIYKLTSAFPDDERFGLTNQMRRASVSIASNIAEGYGRATRDEYVQFPGHVRGSCSEVETQLVIAKALDFGKPDDMMSVERLCSDVGRLFGGLMKSQRGSRSLVPSPSVPSPSVPSPSFPQSLSKEHQAH